MSSTHKRLERADAQDHVAFFEVADRVPPRLNGGVQVRRLLPVEGAVEHGASYGRLDMEQISGEGACVIELAMEESPFGRGRPQPGHMSAC